MSDESGGPSLGVARKKKIAIGVIFTLSAEPEENSRFQDFFFSHFPLFESHMNKLKGAIEQVSFPFLLSLFFSFSFSFQVFRLTLCFSVSIQFRKVLKIASRDCLSSSRLL